MSTADKAVRTFYCRVLSKGKAKMTDWATRTEQDILDQALKLAPKQGWTWPMVRAAGAAAGLSGPETELLLPMDRLTWPPFCPAGTTRRPWRPCLTPPP